MERIQRGQTTGHEIPLAKMIKNKTMVKIYLSSGDHFTGYVSQFDKFSVTLINWTDNFSEVQDVKVGPRTFFKHSIDSFEAHEADTVEVH
jgi:RNA chaperone Hfq